MLTSSESNASFKIPWIWVELSGKILPLCESLTFMDPKKSKIYIYNKEEKQKKEETLSTKKESEISLLEFDDKPIKFQSRKKYEEKEVVEFLEDDEKCEDEFLVEIRLIVMKIMVFIKEEKSNYYKIILKKHIL